MGTGCLERHSDTCLMVQFLWTFLRSPVQLPLRWRAPSPPLCPPSWLLPPLLRQVCVVTPILPMRKLRPREAKQVAQGHFKVFPGSKW